MMAQAFQRAVTDPFDVNKVFLVTMRHLGVGSMGAHLAFDLCEEDLGRPRTLTSATRLVDRSQNETGNTLRFARGPWLALHTTHSAAVKPLLPLA